MIVQTPDELELVQTEELWYRVNMCGQRLQMGCRIHSGTELSRWFQAVFQESQLEVKGKSNLSLIVERMYILENIYTAACWTG